MRMIALMLAAVAGQANVAAAPQETHVDVPRGHGRQEVVVLERIFPVGGSSGWHVHPGIEIGRVVAGVLTDLAALDAVTDSEVSP